MLVILGKTASGKNTIVNELVKNYGFKQLVTYTTRPKRKGEIEDVTYHYISLEEFKKKDREGFFAETAYYSPASGGEWAYGTSLEDLENADNKTVVILNPNGFYSIAGTPYENPYCIQSVYIRAKDSILYERLGKRGDTAREAARRISSDREDFESIGDCVDFWIANDGTFSIEEIAAAINRRVENKKDK